MHRQWLEQWFGTKVDIFRWKIHWFRLKYLGLYNASVIFIENLPASTELRFIRRPFTINLSSIPFISRFRFGSPFNLISFTNRKIFDILWSVMDIWYFILDSLPTDYSRTDERLLMFIWIFRQSAWNFFEFPMIIPILEWNPQSIFNGINLLRNPLKGN